MSRLSLPTRFFRRAVRRVMSRISQDDLRATLDTLMRGTTNTMVVHSSLSRCGYFTNGPEGVLQALRDSCETLVLPTHSYCYPPAPDKPAPLFDARTTASNNGLLTERFRQQHGVVRSIHSTHSIAATGPAAAQLCAGHYELNTPCGAGTPYSRLLERRTSALMFGVTFHAYTFFHTAEDAAGSAYAYERETVDRLRVRTEAGIERECLSRRQTRNPRRFAETGELLERAGLVRRLALGDGVLLYAEDCANVHDFLIERLRRTPDFLFQTSRVDLQ